VEDVDYGGGIDLPSRVDPSWSILSVVDFETGIGGVLARCVTVIGSRHGN
jgi:hypothetical protein